jgi:hypothetical protein
MTLCCTVLASSRAFLSTIRNSTAVKISDTRPPADSQPGAARVAVSNMTDTHIAPSIGFTPSERAYIRTELDIFFSTLPTVAEGFQLKTWRGGPDRGKPKLSPVAKGLLDRGLMRLDTSEQQWRCRVWRRRHTKSHDVGGLIPTRVRRAFEHRNARDFCTPTSLIAR